MPIIEIFDLDDEQAAHKAQTVETPAPKKSRGPRKSSAPKATSSAQENTTQGLMSPVAAAMEPKAAAAKKQPTKRAPKATDDENAPKSRGGRRKKDPDAVDGAVEPQNAAETTKVAKASAPARNTRGAKDAAKTENAKSEKSPRSEKIGDGEAPQKSRSSRGPKRTTHIPDHEPVAVATPETVQIPAPGSNETPVSSFAPHALQSTETAAFLTAPPSVEFSPTQMALSMSRSILPAVEPPLTPLAAPNAAKDGEPDDDDEQRPSRSRSRSARRRKAAARRRAEAASGSPVDDDNALELSDTESDDPEDDQSNVIAVAPDGAAEFLIAKPAVLRAEIDDVQNADLSDGALKNAALKKALENIALKNAALKKELEDDALKKALEDNALENNALEDDALEDDADDSSAAAENAEEDAPKKKRSRSRGRGRKKKKTPAEETEGTENTEDTEDTKISADSEDAEDFDEDEYDEEAEPRRHLPKTDRKMLVSVLPGELVEVVMLETGKVQEYYVEMEHHAKIRGNIYKGIVSNIDVNLQAAFVNYGNIKNGFLQIDEVHPEYWLTHHDATKGHKYPPIQKVMKPGQEVLVQVVKEPNGAKGAFLTTWVSLAGRFLVLTPGQEQIGISRKVEDGEERNRLRELIKGLEPGEGLGAIVRTVSAGTSKTTLQKDLSFLKRVWKDIRKRAGTEKAPSLVYKEPSLATRSVRDYLSEDVSEVWVDDAETAEAIRDMTSLLFPRKGDLLHLHQEPGKTLWEHFKVRKYLDQIHSREVVLPAGGRLVFDQTEALMAIDINSGKTGGKTNFESMALRTNVEAAEMIAHQLRLRDIGGQVVIDFIEMRDQNHVREVEKTLRNAMKCDRARYDIGKMSAFGLLQIVRQRIGSSAISISQETCPHCQGTGLRRNLEWQTLQLLRDLKVQMRTANNSGQTELVLPLESELALYVLNHKRERLSTLEKEYGIRLEVKVSLS